LVEPRSPLKLAEKVKKVLKIIEEGQIDSLIEAAHRDAAEFSFASRARYFLENSINRPTFLELIER